MTKSYQAYGRALAMREVPPAGGAGTLLHLLADHLGGTVEVLDAAGVTVAETKYWPYGATRTATGVAQTDKLFTGQQQESGDAALGLYHYKARFYSTTLGRFVSADPLDVGLSRYAYVANNPLRWIDPTGYECRVWPVPRDPQDCVRRVGGRIATGVDQVRDVAGRGADAAADSARAALRWFNDQFQQVRQWAQSVTDYAYGLTEWARLAWRLSYENRSSVTRSIESAVLLSSKWEKITTISGNQFGLVFPVRIVFGCGGLVCDSVRSGNSPAMTIGHTIFTWWTSTDVAANYNEFLKMLAHELVHVAQFEDLDDAFLVWWLGEGGAWWLRECVGGTNCNLNDAFHKQYLERSAEHRNYP